MWAPTRRRARTELAPYAVAADVDRPRRAQHPRARAAGAVGDRAGRPGARGGVRGRPRARHAVERARARPRRRGARLGARGGAAARLGPRDRGPRRHREPLREHDHRPGARDRRRPARRPSGPSRARPATSSAAPARAPGSQRSGRHSARVTLVAIADRPTFSVLSPVAAGPRSPSTARSGPRRSARSCSSVGDATYPFIAILEGEVAVLDAAGQRDRPPRRLRLPRRDEPALRADRLPDRGRRPSRCATSRSTARSCGSCSSRTARSPTCCSPPSSSGASCCSSARGSGSRSSARATRSETRRLVDFARRSGSPHLARPRGRRRGGGAGRRARRRASCRWCGCPAAPSCGAPSQRRALAGARDRARAGAARGGRPAGHRRRAGRASAPPSTAPRRASTRW